MRLMVLIIGVIFGVTIQATWLAHLNLPGMVKPDLIFIMTLSYGLLRGSDEGTIFGLTAGLFVDFLSGNVIGIGALSKMLAGFSAGLLEKAIFKDSLVVPALAAFLGTIVFELFSISVHLAFHANINFFNTLVFAILPLALYNALIAPVIYHLLFRFENYMAEKASDF